MHGRLIVGFDRSEASLTALRWAAAEGEVRGASVRVISSYSMPPLMNYYGMSASVATKEELQHLKDACSAELGAAVAQSLRRHPSVGFDYQAVDEAPVKALVREAALADLMVVGSSGAGAVMSFLLSSVTGAVLHASPCPVVVVPAKLRKLTGRLVVGVDGSECSNAAVRWAIGEADRFGVGLDVVHAWVYPYRLTAEGFARGSEIAEVDAAIVLERAVEMARDGTVGAVTGRLVEGGAAKALLDASETADMIIVGSRGRGGFRSMLLGSVAQAVSAHAVCPVVVVR